MRKKEKTELSEVVMSAFWSFDGVAVAPPSCCGSEIPAYKSYRRSRSSACIPRRPVTAGIRTRFRALKSYLSGFPGLSHTRQPYHHRRSNGAFYWSLKGNNCG